MSTTRRIAAATGLTLAATAGFCAYASINAESQIFGRTLVAPPAADQVLLTFDDGPNPAITPWLLDVLAHHGVRATFFVIGRFVRMEPALTRRIAAGGHALGNHTLNHRYLTLLPEAALRAELAGCNAELEDALGEPVHLFRPPHGARRPAVLRIAAELGLRTVQYNAIVGDWKPIAPEALAERIAKRITWLRAARRGTNLVLHDGSQAGLGAERHATVAAVDRLLPELKRESRFVLPDDCLGGPFFLDAEKGWGVLPQRAARLSRA
jgi:peptidoglycan/xylan/chitin deacetylase (PgdA/CDA1 family)